MTSTCLMKVTSPGRSDGMDDKDVANNGGVQAKRRAKAKGNSEKKSQKSQKQQKTKKGSEEGNDDDGEEAEEDCDDQKESEGVSGNDEKQ